MASAALEGKLRDQKGKSAARQIRRENSLPGVLYGLKDNLLLKVNPKQLHKIFEKKGQNVLIELNLEGDSAQKRQVILKDYQKHPLQEDWLHVDFLEVDMNKKTKVQVPVKLLGHSPGEKLGGLVNHVMKEVHVECLPADIPEVVEIDLTQVQLGEVVHVKDLPLSDTMTIIDNPADTVVSVYLEKIKEEAPAEGEEGEAAEGEAAAEAPEDKDKDAEKKEGS